jgi:uncharacterized membrane protein YhaH (DUF805 family)
VARLRSLLTWHGRIGRAAYAAVGTTLVVVKYGLDRLVADAFGRDWDYFDYWTPSSYALRDLPRGQWSFFAALLGLSLPFLAVGLALTSRRLRDVGLPLWLLALFFVPVVNLFFFVLLALLPPREGTERPIGPIARAATQSKWRSAVAGTVLVGIVAVALVIFGVDALGSYGWGLFVASPFCLGVVSVLVFAYAEPRTLRACVGVGGASVVVASIALIAVAQEGAICLFMAVPLTLPLGALGGAVGYTLQRRRVRAAGTPHVMCSLLLVGPLVMGVESAAHRRPPLIVLRTSVIVDAPPAVVWRRVVAFPPLAPPRELVFRTGIAYPIGARIDGRGVGAIRRCSFSTGDFVEPITVWDAPRLLRFDVRAQPPPMKELSPYGAIHPPHLDGFLRSARGQFLLRQLPHGRTLLEGTTWYRNRMWPSAYWRLWSDALIHRIHRRVLRHVERLAEADASTADVRDEP